MLPVRRLLCVAPLLVLCLLTHPGASLPRSAQSGRRLEILPTAEHVYFEAQKAAVLTCKAVGDQPSLFSELRWAGPDSQDNWEELKKRHRISYRGGNTAELIIKNPTTDDTGEYRCTGTYQSSDHLNASIKVTVFNPIKFENCPDRQFVIEGQANQRVSCRVTADKVQLTVSRNGKLIESTDQRYKWDGEAITILDSAGQSDEATFTIDAKSELTGRLENKDIQVEVHSAPKFVPREPLEGGLAEFTGIEGQQVELKCDAVGKPKPLVYWFDPKRRNLTSVGGYFVNPEAGTLLISKVNRVDDNGSFECRARNDVSEIFRPVSMAVLVRPAITKFENKTVEEGQEVTFECRATGFPRPKFSIRRQGANQLPYQVGDGNVTDISEDEEGGGAQVYIYRVKVRASKVNYGIHYCNATNAAGNGPESIGQLFVKYRPDLGATPTVQYAKLNAKNLTVTCHIRAYPAPLVNWLDSDGRQIINAVNSFKTNPDGQTHFATMMLPTHIEGKFRCNARNDLGNVEQVIELRFKQRPGLVNAVVLRSTPTTVDVQLSVTNDGGDGVKAFKYRLEGITNDPFNPVSYKFRKDIQNETYIQSISPSSVYTIRNLLPNYRYTLTIRAINEEGPGSETEIPLETRMASRPEAPNIIKPGVLQLSQPAFTSDYSDGFVLKWSPPDLDNGDPINKYLIKINRVNPEFPDSLLDEGEERLLEQTNERPLHAKLGPLEPNRYYKIQLYARNNYGDSDPAKIVIFTNPDRPNMPDYGPEALTWLTEPSTPILIGLLILAIISLIIIDVIFCFCYQMGVSHSIRGCCCPQKANSVISDKTFT